MDPIVSPHCRIRHPEHFKVGAYSIVDDFCYFSTQVQIGMGSHIATGCSVAGGKARRFRLGDLSSISAGTRIWCTSNDYAQDLVAIVPDWAAPIGDAPIAGDVSIADYTGVGANSVIMPGNDIPVGTTLGALSFVPPGFRFEPWSVYAGAPIRLVGRRNRERVLQQAELLRARLAARQH